MFPPYSANYAFDDSPIAAEELDLLDTRFKAIPSLKEIIVNFQVYAAEDPDDYPGDYPIKMRDRGWTVKVTKLRRKFGSVMMTESNLTIKRIAMCIIINSSSSNCRESKRKRISSGRRNITREDVIPIGRTIRTTIEQLLWGGGGGGDD